MSRKSFFIGGGLFILIINVSVFATLYLSGVIFQPSAQEIEAERLAQEEAANALKEAERYANLEPLPEFKSKANYVRSMGQAIQMCEAVLHEKEPSSKTWAVNYVESRYLPNKETYLVFIDYETIALSGAEPKVMKATCEVSESENTVASWSAKKLEI